MVKPNRFIEQSISHIHNIMEFFVPSLIVFILSLFITFLIAPKMTPLLAAVLSLAFLTYGVYDHYHMFASEYRLSTWQDGLQMYSPAIMIGAILLFVVYGIMAFFTSGKVPVPAMPNIELPTNLNLNMNTNLMNLPKNMGNTFNTIANTTTHLVNNVGETLGNTVNTTMNAIGLGHNRGNGISRSFLETV